MRDFVGAFLLCMMFSSISNAAVGIRVSEDIVYTLYRSSAASGGQSKQIHIATFDASEGEEYNSGNCNLAQQLFQAQPGVTVRYWCEKGYFRK